MDLAIHIPTWLMWTVGILAGVGVTVLAVLGVMFCVFMHDFRPF